MEPGLKRQQNELEELIENKKKVENEIKKIYDTLNNMQKDIRDTELVLKDFLDLPIHDIINNKLSFEENNRYFKVDGHFTKGYKERLINDSKSISGNNQNKNKRLYDNILENSNANQDIKNYTKNREIGFKQLEENINDLKKFLNQVLDKDIKKYIDENKEVENLILKTKEELKKYN